MPCCTRDRVIIRIWTGNISQRTMGHISIETSFGYMSLWPDNGPTENSSIKSALFQKYPPQCMDKPSDDYQAEHRAPELVFCLYDLRPDFIASKWEKIFGEIKGWKAIGRQRILEILKLEEESVDSCASLAYELLEAGGIDHTDPFGKPRILPPINNIQEFIRRIIDAKQYELDECPEVTQHEFIFDAYKYILQSAGKEEAMAYLYQASLHDWSEEDRDNFFKQDQLSNHPEVEEERSALNNMNENVNKLINHRKEQDKKRFHNKISLAILFASLLTLAPVALVYYCIARISLWAQKKTTSYTLSVKDYLKYKQYKKEEKDKENRTTEQAKKQTISSEEDSVPVKVRKKTVVLVDHSSKRTSDDKSNPTTANTIGNSSAILTQLNAKLIQGNTPIKTEEQLTENDLSRKIQVIGSNTDMKKFREKVKLSKKVQPQPQ